MRAQFPRLSGLADSIDTNGWSSPEECSQILTQTCEKHETYMGLLGPQISLFHKEELRNAEKRNKFMRRLRMATKHLLDIYCTQDAAIGIEAFSLPQHPSHGMKEIADKVYFALQQHWRCNCSQRRIKSNGAREARLSLTRHRQMGMKIDSGGAPGPAKFEVVLPLCKDDTDWKVTNIEVRHSR